MSDQISSFYNELSNLGWNNAFAQQAACRPDDTVARVAAVDRDQLVLLDQMGAFRAKLAGSYLYHHVPSTELPGVGDWVGVEKPPGDGMAVVHSLIARQTVLRRKTAGQSTTAQIIAANIDTVMIVQSCHFDFNLKRLERYLVMIREGGAEAVILLTKTDLVDPAVLAAQLDEIRVAGIHAPVLTLSNVTQEGVATLRQQLLPGKTYCFVGSSGVGKSTLINQLLGQDVMGTGMVSGTGEGRHTTVRRELIRLAGGALVIDNPGMREFGILADEVDMDACYGDITALAAACRYRDCSHMNESGCAVQAAIHSGRVSQAHFDNYLKLKGESSFNQMSLAEKRKKDRDFGKHVKSVKKHLKTNW